MRVGWRLAEEVSWARPERPGPEWWTLLDIAQDARDETRQSMCGQDYLMARGKCSKATLYRRIKALTDAGLIKVVRKSAPGVRAVYEVLVIHTFESMGLSVSETRSGLSVSETRSAGVIHNGSQNGGQRVSKTGPTGLSVSETHAVRYAVTTTPSTSKNSVADSPVEGGVRFTDEPSGEIANANDPTPLNGYAPKHRRAAPDVA